MSLRIDAEFPGGNIIVERIDGATAYVRQDLRDTASDWFYWYFRAQGAAGQKLKIVFTGSPCIGVHGPAVSEDGGLNWRWLGEACVEGQSFTHQVPANCNEVRYCVCVPYVQRDLDAWLAKHAGNPALAPEVLCKTQKPKGQERWIEGLKCGRLDGKAAQRVLLTARHHACEATANFVLEGLFDAVLAEDELGKWLRGHVEFWAIPFVDKDGVEQGDQGKYRKPHDHNRDYTDTPIYNPVRVLKQFAPEWCKGHTTLALDLHAPCLRGGMNELLYFVGPPLPEHWAETQKLGRALEANLRGPLIYRAENNLPFGTDWNTDASGLAKTFSRWVQTVPGVKLGVTLEIPYANAQGSEVNAAALRAFGRDLAAALGAYLKS